MKWLLQFILSHSIFISFCAVALSLQSLVLLQHPINPYIISFIFFATLAGYNAYWIVSRYSFSPHQAWGSFLLKCRSALLVIFVALTGLLYCLSKVHLVMYNTVATAGLLLIYAVPVMPFKALHFTRKAGFLKTVVLALAWTIVTILIPLQQSVFEVSTPALLLFGLRFLFMLMLCIIFDKRDAAVDKIRGLQSLATDLKSWFLHVVMVIVFLMYTLLAYLLSRYGIPWSQVIALLIAGVISLGVYLLSIKKKSYFFYYFLVDGLMILSASFTFLADRFYR